MVPKNRFQKGEIEFTTTSCHYSKTLCCVHCPFTNQATRSWFLLTMEDVSVWKCGDLYKVALFYRYVFIADTTELINTFLHKATDLELLGRILVGKEGINGTLAGSPSSVDSFETFLRSDERFKTIDMKFSTGRDDNLPFLSLSIREVDEIVSTGQMKSFIEQNIGFDSSTFGGITGTGVHLTPEEFHSAIQRKDGIVLDIRNKFEFDIGHFDGSIGLDTFYYSETFDALNSILDDKCKITHGAEVKQDQKTHEILSTQSNEYNTTNSDSTIESSDVKSHQESPNGSLVPESDDTTIAVATPETSCAPADISASAEDTNIYMYCTGGIRCEKASAYLKAKGYNNVFQVRGKPACLTFDVDRMYHWYCLFCSHLTAISILHFSWSSSVDCIVIVHFYSCKAVSINIWRRIRTAALSTARTLCSIAVSPWGPLSAQLARLPPLNPMAKRARTISLSQIQQQTIVIVVVTVVPAVAVPLLILNSHRASCTKRWWAAASTALRPTTPTPAMSPARSAACLCWCARAAYRARCTRGSTTVSDTGK